MPTNKRRRLAKEARAIVTETKRSVEELKKCVARSRELLDESKMLLAGHGRAEDRQDAGRRRAQRTVAAE
jgi:hypothetical protein